MQDAVLLASSNRTHAIIIATPTAQHATHAAQAAKRGWHMLVEKPVVAKPDEAAGLIDAVTSAKVHCLVGHHRRHHPQLATPSHGATSASRLAPP